jgi:tRNA A-37 threonylcarbamoyl transferase component Bud32
MAREAQPGQVIGGRYRLVDELGLGGFGCVWRALDETLGVDVAVKEMRLPPDLSDAERSERVARAKREARHAAHLRDHPNIVAVYDIVTEGGVPFVVMRLVEGRSLEKRLREPRPPLPVEKAVKVARGVLTALEAAHAAGIVHRDIKPSNVMLADGGEVLLTDFGIAVHRSDAPLTQVGMFVGSPGYVAPERVGGNGGNGSGGGASDLFSLGVTLYQAVEGVPPFGLGVPGAVMTDEPPPPQRAEGLAPLIMRLLEKDPGKRPSIAEALAMLDAITPDGTGTGTGTATAVIPQVPQPPPVPPPPVTPPTQPHPVIAAAPKARELAAEHGIDLARVNATGDRGQVTVPDVRFAMKTRQEAQARRAKIRRRVVRWTVVVGPLLLSVVLFGPRLYDTAYDAGSVYDAETDDCIWVDRDDRHRLGLAPCALPKLGADNYQVLLRIDDTTDTGECREDDVSTLARAFPYEDMVLCLAPN